jgi:uncharacterized protein (TIGR02246 family)
MIRFQILTAAFLVMVAAAPSSAQQIAGVTGNTAAEKEVRAAEEQMHNAYVSGDHKLFRNLFADDSTFTASNGTTIGPDRRVKGLRAYKDLQDEVVSIKVLGDVALVRTISRYASAEGKERAHLTILRVWHKRDGRWQVVAYQATSVQQPTKTDGGELY